MKRACVLFAAITCGCSGVREQTATRTGPAATRPWLEASEADLWWWQEAKFGLFIHWGPVSIQGTEIGWSRGGERRGRGKGGPIPVQIYDNLYKRFNPEKFNADEWVRVARLAGMKYLVFTSKHHDGFCMFDTKLSEYKITNSPFKRDICAELAAACHRHGMRLGWYYSPVDWHHPDYRTANHAKYVEYMHGQLRELCTNYGKVDIIWFDGLGGTAEEWDSETLFQMIRALQPGVLINNRAGLDADYDTPEQTIGRFQIERPWESCMTIGEQWAWRPNDKLKTVDVCAEILVRTVGGGGNLLLNVGPMPTGEIEPRQVAILLGLGQWLRTVAPAVYGTRPGPFKPGPWGASTCRGRSVYLHVLLPESDRLELPPIGARIRKAHLHGGGAVWFEQNDRGVSIRLPAATDRAVIVLALDRDAAGLPPVQLVSGSLAAGRPVSKDGNGENAVDDDYSTCWTANASSGPARLEVDLGAPTRVGRAIICELLNRVQQFELQFQQGEQWVTLVRGERIGSRLLLQFEPVTARKWRLSIDKGAGWPGAQISEFQLFAPE